jgi:2-methylisocitrate lyase-like PEP mutase family enzyme
VSKESSGVRLRSLLARKDKVLAVLGVHSARVGQLMDRTGCEAGFVGTNITYGNYTGLPDTGVASATECLMIGGYIARAVSFHVLLDGDTGHGGRDAVRRLVSEAIREGLAGLRLDDQPIEEKRRTQTAGISVVDREAAVERYRTAVEARDEIDPDFVIMAQCYARDATNGGMEEALERLELYGREAGVDWVQFEGPHSVSEVKLARAKVSGPLSAMQGRMERPLTLEEHAEIGLDAAWYTFLPAQYELAEVLRFLREYEHQGIGAWTSWAERNRDLLSEIGKMMK